MAHYPPAEDRVENDLELDRGHTGLPSAEFLAPLLRVRVLEDPPENLVYERLIHRVAIDFGDHGVRVDVGGPARFNAASRGSETSRRRRC
jgi:hypothetical protein